MTRIFQSLLLFCVSTGFAQNSKQWGNLQPGPYGIGYKAIQTRDSSRNYINGCRPIQIYMWYPCEKGKSNVMTFQQYLNDAKRDLGDSNIFAQHLESRLIEEFKNGSLNPSYGSSFGDEDYKRTVDTSVPVILNGEPIRSKFPLLLHIHANGALHQSLMMEYLASYGYTIMSISMYNTSPAHYGRGEEGSNAMLSQVEDLVYLISEARKFDFIDSDKIAMIGMVAQAGLALQMKERFLSAIACLDCQLNEKTMADLPFYSAESISIPVLQMINTQFQKQEKGYMESLNHSERYLYRFRNFPHSDFYPFPKIAAPEKSSSYVNYEFVLTSTLHFLNTFLKNQDEEKETLLNPKVDHNVPVDYVIVRKLHAQEPVMSEGEFLTLLRFGELQAAQKEWNQHPQIRKGILKENFFSVVLFLCRDGEQHAYDALKMYNSVYAGEPQVEILFKLLGISYIKSENNLAESVYEDYHKNFPDAPSALEGLITACQIAGKKSKAKIAAQSLIELVNRLEPTESEKARLLAIAEKVITEK